MKTLSTFHYKLIALFLVSGVVLALFMPFFQTETDGMQREPYRFISQYQTQAGFLTTYNGFGSSFGIFNACLSLALTTIVFLFEIKNKTLIWTGLILYLLSHFFVLLTLISAPIMLSSPDKLLAGYAVLSTSEIGLFICFFNYANKNKSFHSEELLDHPE